MNQTVSAIHPRLTNRGGEAPHQCPPTRAIGLLNNSIQNKTKVHSVTKGHNQRLVMFPYHSHSWKQHKRTVFGRVIGSHSWGYRRESRVCTPPWNIGPYKQTHRPWKPARSQGREQQISTAVATLPKTVPGGIVGPHKGYKVTEKK